MSEEPERSGSGSGRLPYAPPMTVAPPFVLLPLDDGRFELRVFSGDSPDPIVLELDKADGRSFGLAVAEVLTALDTPDATVEPLQVVIAGRELTIDGTSARGLGITVARP